MNDDRTNQLLRPGASRRARRRTADLVRRRAAALGPAYRLFYREPLEFVRGERAHLFDRDGTDYLDAYNNVPSVGHAHPVWSPPSPSRPPAEHPHPVPLARDGRLRRTPARHVPPPNLPRMFTCTGSEANDLALRIANAATGGNGVIVT